jgi:hypothetical protein
MFCILFELKWKERNIPTWLEILENLGRAKLKTENKFKDGKGKERGEQEEDE